MQVRTFAPRYSPGFQLYRDYAAYPMTFMQAPAFDGQILISYEGQTALRGLPGAQEPFMFPVRNQIMYPRTHSIPDQFQRTYINLVGGYPANPQIIGNYYPRRGPL